MYRYKNNSVTDKLTTNRKLTKCLKIYKILREGIVFILHPLISHDTHSFHPYNIGNNM